MLFTENGETWESFVYVPKKPIGINPDGTWNYEIVAKLIAAAQKGDNNAQIKLFEQYQYMWKKEITGFVEDMLTYEDAQQEAFYILMKCLITYQNRERAYFLNYYMTALHTHLMEISGNEKALKERCFFSLDEEDENGNQLHSLQDYGSKDITDFSNIKALLTDMEYKIIIAHYYYDIGLKDIAKHYNLSYQYIRLLNSHAIKKLEILI